MSRQCPGGNTTYRKWEQSSDPTMYRTSTCLRWWPSLSCLRSGSRSRGSSLVLVPVRVEACVCLCAGAEDKCVCNQSCPGVISAVPAKAPGPSAQCKRGWFASLPVMEAGWPGESNSWQNLGSYGARGRGLEMRPGRDTSHGVRSGLGAGNQSCCPGTI